MRNTALASLGARHQAWMAAGDRGSKLESLLFAWTSWQFGQSASLKDVTARSFLSTSAQPKSSRANSSQPSQSAGAKGSNTISPTSGANAPSTASNNEASTAAPKSRLLLPGFPSVRLKAEDVGSYYKLQRGLLPEAFKSLHRAFYPAGNKREGGCRGLLAEMTATTPLKSASGAPVSDTSVGKPALMHRPLAHGLMERLLKAPGAGERVLLRGPRGSGKSCVLVALVERMRAEGWLALYIPSAAALMRGGYFTPRLDPLTGAPTGMYDTMISAQHILLGMQRAHGKKLAELPLKLDASKQLLASTSQDGHTSTPSASSSSSSGAVKGAEASGEEAGKAAGTEGSNKAQTLADLVTAGLATDSNAALAVDAALAVVAELSALASPEQPVLFAIDEYNMLHGPSDYGEHVADEEEGAAVGGQARRKLLKADQLTLARGLQLLSAPLPATGSAKVVASVTWSPPKHMEVPPHDFPTQPPSSSSSSSSRGKEKEGPTQEVFVPRYNQVEMAHALYRYYETGLSPQAPSKRQVLRMLALTNGNGVEVRRLAHRLPLLELNDPDAVHAFV